MGYSSCAQAARLRRHLGQIQKAIAARLAQRRLCGFWGDLPRQRLLALLGARRLC